MLTLGVSSSWTPGRAGSASQLDRRIRLEFRLCKSRRCDVFELRSVASVFVHPLLVYAPNAQGVHIEPAAEWDSLIASAAKLALGVHPSTSFDLVFAPTDYGGLGFQTCVAQVLANSARELLVSFVGAERQAQVRRGRWVTLCKRAPRAEESPEYLLEDRMLFMASKGWYLRDAQELFQTRVVAKLALVGPGWGNGGYGKQNKREDEARARYSSAGNLFAAIRRGFARSPTVQEAVSQTW